MCGCFDHFHCMKLNSNKVYKGCKVLTTTLNLRCKARVVI